LYFLHCMCILQSSLRAAILLIKEYYMLREKSLWGWCCRYTGCNKRVSAGVHPAGDVRAEAAAGAHCTVAQPAVHSHCALRRQRLSDWSRSRHSRNSVWFARLQSRSRSSLLSPLSADQQRHLLRAAAADAVARRRLVIDCHITSSSDTNTATYMVTRSSSHQWLICLLTPTPHCFFGVFGNSAYIFWESWHFPWT